MFFQRRMTSVAVIWLWSATVLILLISKISGLEPNQTEHSRQIDYKKYLQAGRFLPTFVPDLYTERPPPKVSENKVQNGQLRQGQPQQNPVKSTRTGQSQLTQAQPQQNPVKSATAGQSQVTQGQPQRKPDKLAIAGQNQLTQAQPQQNPVKSATAGQSQLTQGQPQQNPVKSARTGQSQLTQGQPQRKADKPAIAGQSHLTQSQPQQNPVKSATAGQSQPTQGQPQQKPIKSAKARQGQFTQGQIQKLIPTRQKIEVQPSQMQRTVTATEGTNPPVQLTPAQIQQKSLGQQVNPAQGQIQKITHNKQGDVGQGQEQRKAARLQINPAQGQIQHKTRNKQGDGGQGQVQQKTQGQQKNPAQGQIQQKKNMDAKKQTIIQNRHENSLTEKSLNIDNYHGTGQKVRGQNQKRERVPYVRKRSWKRSVSNWNNPNITQNGPSRSWNHHAPWDGPPPNWDGPPPNWNGPPPNGPPANWNGPPNGPPPNWNGPPNGPPPNWNGPPNGPPPNWNGPPNGPPPNWNGPPNGPPPNWNGPMGKLSWNGQNGNWNRNNQMQNQDRNSPTQNQANNSNRTRNSPNGNQNNAQNRNQNSPINRQNPNNGTNKNRNIQNNNQNQNNSPNRNWNGQNNQNSGPNNQNSGPNNQNRNWNSPSNQNSGPNRNWNDPNNQNSGPNNQNRNWNGPNSQNSGPNRNWNGPNNQNRNWNGPNNQNNGPNKNWNGPNNQNQNSPGNWGSFNFGGPGPHNMHPPPPGAVVGMPLIDPDLPDGLDDRWQRMQAYRAWQEMNHISSKMGMNPNPPPWGPDPYPPQGQMPPHGPPPPPGGPYPPPPGPYPPPGGPYPPPPGPYPPPPGLHPPFPPNNASFPPGPYLPNKFFGTHTSRKFGWPIKHRSRAEVWGNGPRSQASKSKLPTAKNPTEISKLNNEAVPPQNTTNRLNNSETKVTNLKPQLAEFQYTSSPTGWERRRLLASGGVQQGGTQTGQGVAYPATIQNKNQTGQGPPYYNRQGQYPGMVQNKTQYQYNYPFYYNQPGYQGMYRQMRLNQWPHPPVPDTPDHLEDRSNSTSRQTQRKYPNTTIHSTGNEWAGAKPPNIRVNSQMQNRENEMTLLQERQNGLARSVNIQPAKSRQSGISSAASNFPPRRDTVDRGIQSVKRIGQQSQSGGQFPMATGRQVWRLANHRLQKINVKASVSKGDGDVEKEKDEEKEGGGIGIDPKNLKAIISEVYRQRYNKNISTQSIMNGLQDGEHKLKINYRYESEGNQPLMNEGEKFNPESFQTLNGANSTALGILLGSTQAPTTTSRRMNTAFPRPNPSEVIVNQHEMTKIRNTPANQHYPRSGASFGNSAKYWPYQPIATNSPRMSVTRRTSQFNGQTTMMPWSRWVHETTTRSRSTEKPLRSRTYVRRQPLGIIKNYPGAFNSIHNVSTTAIPKLSDLLDLETKTFTSTNTPAIQVKIETEIKAEGNGSDKETTLYIHNPANPNTQSKVNQVGITLPYIGGVTPSTNENATTNATKSERIQQTPVEIETTLTTSSAFGIVAGVIIGFLVLLGPIICILCRVKKNRREKQRKLSSRQMRQSADDGGIMEAMILQELGESDLGLSRKGNTSAIEKCTKETEYCDKNTDYNEIPVQTLNSGRQSPMVIVH